jgi:rRNA-processing protein FCF1
MNLKVKVVDEKGLFRLNQSVVLIKSDFDSLFKKNKEKVVQNPIVIEMDQRNAKTLEKLQYVIEFLSTNDDELKNKIKEREMVGFEKPDIQ